MESQREPHLIGYKKKVPPSPHACKTQLVRESCQTASTEKRRRSCTYRIILGNVCSTYTSHLDNSHSLFFTHTDWFYAVNTFCSSLNCCFCLQITDHRLAVLFDRILAKKRAKSVSAEKWKAEEYRLYLFRVSMKLQFHNTWITLAKKVKCCDLFFLHLNLDLHLYKSFLAHAKLIYVCNHMYTCTTLTLHMQIF